MMAYIETHQSLLTHRKTLRLGRLLGMDRFCVVGRLVALWGWALDNAPDGVVAVADADILADVMGWGGEPGQLCDALLGSGFFELDDGFYVLHDWYVYAGKLIEKRQANAERMRTARARASRPSDAAGALDDARAGNVQRTCDERAGATVPNRTQPDRSPEIPEGISAPAVLAGAVASPAPSPPPSRSEGDAGVSTPDGPAAGSEPAPEAKSAAPKLKPIYGDDSVPMQLARTLGAGIHRNKPDAKLPRDGLQSWAREFDLMLRVDHRPREKIEAVIAYAMRSSFWRSVVFSAAQIRRKFDVIDAQRQEDASGTRNRQAAANGNGAPRQPSRGYSNAPRRLPTQDEYRDLARKLGQIPPDAGDGGAGAGDRRADEAASGESAGSAAPLAQATGT